MRIWNPAVSILYEAKRYDLHPVVRGIVAESLQPEDRNRFGQQVVDHFSSIRHNPYEQVETIEDLSGGLHLVRTLVKMDKFQEACNIYRGALSSALFFNLDATSEVLSLLKPFFPSGWSTLPNSVSERDASHLANDAAIALGRRDDLKSSMDAYGVALESGLRTEDWAGACGILSNVGDSLASQNKIAQHAAIAEMEVEMASASGIEASIFVSLLRQFVLTVRIGQWSQAQAIWNQLDPMGRPWSRATYRPGIAELWHAYFIFWQGKLQEEQLAEAERSLKVGRDRTSIRSGHSLRCQWHLERHEWPLAAACLHEAVAMARAVGQTDVESETQLALARFHLNQLPDPHHEAERLAHAPYTSNVDLAELYLALGDPDRAKHLALAAFKWHWADGEPYVYRYNLNKSRALLEKLNVPIPNLPPCDPSKRQPFPWEPAVHATIAKLRAEKAEKEAKARGKTAGTE